MLCIIVICYNSVFYRTNCYNVSWSSSKHKFCFITNCHNFICIFINAHTGEYTRSY